MKFKYIFLIKYSTFESKSEYIIRKEHFNFITFLKNVFLIILSIIRLYVHINFFLFLFDIDVRHGKYFLNGLVWNIFFFLLNSVQFIPSLFFSFYRTPKVNYILHKIHFIVIFLKCDLFFKIAATWYCIFCIDISFYFQ